MDGTPHVRVIDFGLAKAQPSHGDAAMASFTRDGEFMSYYGPESTSYQGRTIVVRDPRTFEPLGPPLPPQTWGSFEVSPDRSVVAVGDIFEAQVRVYDVETAELRHVLREPLPADSPIGIFNMRFSPNGDLLATAPLGPVVIWDTATWTPHAVVEPPENDRFFAVAFASDGRTLALGLVGGAAMLYDLETEALTPLEGGAVTADGVYHSNSLEFSADDRLLALAGQGGVTLVDLSSNTQLGAAIPSPGATPSIAPGGSHAVTGTEDHLLVWNLNPGDWQEIACLAAGRNLTVSEWEQFGPSGMSYQAPCNQWPNPAS